MKILKLFFDASSGYKTYLSAAALVVLAIVQIASGQVLQGLQTLLSAFAAAGLRHAIHVATTTEPVA